MANSLNASETGKNFKENVRTTVEENGHFIEITSIREMNEKLAEVQAGTIAPLAKHFAVNLQIGKDTYDCPWKADFVTINGANAPGSQVRVLHVRWQQVGGSVDQKFPFFVLNAMKLKCQSIFVLGGKGFKPGARKWLQNQKGNKIIEVFTQDEFQEWVNNGNL